MAIMNHLLPKIISVKPFCRNTANLGLPEALKVLAKFVQHNKYVFSSPYSSSPFLKIGLFIWTLLAAFYGM